MKLSLSLRIFLGCVVVAASGPVVAQVAGPVPEQLSEVGVEEHLDARLPLDLVFVDEDGGEVRLGDYFERGRPVILTLNYYRCPMLCGLQLTGLLEGMMQLAWTPGDQFEVVTVSIDPLEGPELASRKKASYMEHFGRPGAAQGWHFLTGEPGAISRLAGAVGFGYRYDEEERQYAHPAVIFLCSPDGRVVRYLYGVDYPERNLRLGLLEASQGTIGTPFDRVLLYCYHYDPASRSYAPMAMNIMRLGGGVTVLLLGGTVGLLWLRESRARRGREGV